MSDTKDILVRGLPMETYKKLEKNAKKNLRSITKEAIIAIQKGVK